MTAPVRIDAEAWSDLRFATLARILRLADADHALIKVARIWSWQTEHYTPDTPTYVVDADTIDSALGEGGTAALVRARLAEEMPDGFRIKGTKGKIEWLWKKRQASSKGGEATQGKWRSRGHEAGHKQGHVALERERDDRGAATPHGPPAAGQSASHEAGHMALEREGDNNRGPHGYPAGRPDGLPALGPLPLALDLDQRSEDLFSGVEEPSPEPTGDHDREGDASGYEAWRARRAAEDAARQRALYAGGSRADARAAPIHATRAAVELEQRTRRRQ